MHLPDTPYPPCFRNLSNHFISWRKPLFTARSVPFSLVCRFNTITSLHIMPKTNFSEVALVKNWCAPRVIVNVTPIVEADCVRKELLQGKGSRHLDYDKRQDIAIMGERHKHGDGRHYAGTHEERSTLKCLAHDYFHSRSLLHGERTPTCKPRLMRATSIQGSRANVGWAKTTLLTCAKGGPCKSASCYYFKCMRAASILHGGAVFVF